MVPVKVREVGKFIRDQRAAAELSLRKLSKLTGVSNPYLSQIERGLRRPSAEILQAIAKALRISAETLYVKAGILDERAETVDPVAEILRDPMIGEKHKQILVELYSSFREAARERMPQPPKVSRKVSSPKTARKLAARRATRSKAVAATKTRRAPARARKGTAARKGAAARKGTGRSAGRTAATRSRSAGRRRRG